MTEDYSLESGYWEQEVVIGRTYLVLIYPNPIFEEDGSDVWHLERWNRKLEERFPGLVPHEHFALAETCGRWTISLAVFRPDRKVAYQGDLEPTVVILTRDTEDEAIQALADGEDQELARQILEERGDEW